MKLRTLALGSAASVALLAGGAFAADLPVRSAAPAPVVYAPVFTWTGFYVGLNAGYTTVNTRATHVDAFLGCFWTCGDNYTANGQGFIGGAQIGYNYQMGSIVLGLEADISGASAKDRVVPFPNCCANEYASTSLKAIGTVRARVGMAWDRALFYVTGGLAYAKVDSRFVDFDGDNFLASQTSWKTGWTLGAGVEYALTNNWSVKAEGLYYDLGKKTVAGRNGADAYGMRFETDGFIARVGVNYRFGGAAAPVVARY